MTNLKDKEEAYNYHHLVYVEFLDFISRVGIGLWKKYDKGQADVDKKVFALLEAIWAWRAANPTKIPERRLKKGEEKQPFPELQPIMDIDEEDGQ